MFYILPHAEQTNNTPALDRQLTGNHITSLPASLAAGGGLVSLKASNETLSATAELKIVIFSLVSYVWINGCNPQSVSVNT